MVKDVSVAVAPLHLGLISKAVRRCIGASGGILRPSAGVLESLREAMWARCPISIVGLVVSLWRPVTFQWSRAEVLLELRLTLLQAPR